MDLATKKELVMAGFEAAITGAKPDLTGSFIATENVKFLLAQMDDADFNKKMKAKKGKSFIPGGKRAQRDREMFRLIWPYVHHAFYIFGHCFEKGASATTQHQYVMAAMDVKTFKDGFRTLKPAHFTAKDMRRCMQYYAKKGALTQVGTSQFFRKGW